VKVNWCYYPSDLPMETGRPASENENEVSPILSLSISHRWLSPHGMQFRHDKMSFHVSQDFVGLCFKQSIERRNWIKEFEAGCWSTYAFIGENMLGETALDICDSLSNWTHEHEWECYILSSGIMPTWITN
jgi:hypothetical protein